MKLRVCPYPEDQSDRCSISIAFQDENIFLQMLGKKYTLYSTSTKPGMKRPQGSPLDRVLLIFVPRIQQVGIEGW